MFRDAAQFLSRQAGDLVKNWRRGRDLNPRYPFGYVRFRGGSFQPLTHLSAPRSGIQLISLYLNR